MDSYNEEAVARRLSTLRPTQEQIQTLSLWLLHKRKHSHKIAATWAKELKRERNADKQLSLLFLANDLIQNSRKKWPKYMEDFAGVLPASLAQLAQYATEKTLKSVRRTLNVWRERGIYKAAEMDKFDYAITSHLSSPLLTAWKSLPTAVAPVVKTPKTPNESDVERSTSTPPPPPPSSSTHKRRSASGSASSGSGKRAHVDASLMLPPPEGPSTAELIDTLTQLGSVSSSHNELREKICEYPPTLADPSSLVSVKNEQEVHDMLGMIATLQPLVEEYNNKLAGEQAVRERAQKMLLEYHRAFQFHANTINKMQRQFVELRQKMKHSKIVAQEILEQLPDLSAVPTEESGLAPLPDTVDFD